MSQTSDAHWPPRSPHEVLLSTPGGRDRLRRLAERTSPSPSPIKRTTSAASARKRTASLISKKLPEEEDVEEDEETLQLQLQEIQARLKLKKLQKKAKREIDAAGDPPRAESVAIPRADSVASSRVQSTSRGEQSQSSRSQAGVHVPVSPIRRARPTEDPRSPSRVLLGIDKGLRASDISLKRAPGLRRPKEDDLQETKRIGSFLQRASSRAGSRASADRDMSSQASSREPRILSFSDRLAAMRSQDIDREEKEARRRKNRSMAFDIDHQQMEGFRNTAVEIPNTAPSAPSFSRDEVLKSYNGASSGLTKSRTNPEVRSGLRSMGESSDATTTFQSGSVEHESRPESQTGSSRAKVQPAEVTESEASQFEPYSSIHLSKRIVPHKVLTRTFTGKKTFLIPDLLRIVKGPNFSPPDIEEDMVVLGVIASKSDPKVHQNSGKNEQRGKFMVMTLTDLKWELDLFLFNTAFERFWKLQPGTIVAILNPTIMSPPRGKEATGKFSLTLNSSEDTVLEIGTSRDLGYCKSIRKDGKTCDSWVDKRHTEFCDYHINETLKKTQSNRMEINTMNFSRGRGNGARKYNSRGATSSAAQQKIAEAEKTTRYDRESHSQIFIGRSTANLLDDSDFNPDAFHRGTTKDERVKRTLLAQEKELNLAKQLSRMGGGLGADYMRAKSTTSQRHGDSDLPAAPPPPLDAASLGLLGGKSKDLHLSPIKRRKTTMNSAAIGWGKDLSKQLGKMKDGENLLPVKKKTRFVTAKGIREAGRESLGTEMTAANELDEDDDDLDIVR
ncbi:primase zinc finger [Phlyctema vagabunda]|uniref:Primase zinc finger n=1 Tax=Phlyctema vagabunda TaxID=108571 RepID=A0ABR4PX99_9HELO